MASEANDPPDTPSTGTSTRIVYLDSLRGIAIVMVVCIHTTGCCGLDGAVRDAVAFLVQTAAVPIFFLCDGLLLSLRASANTSFRYGGYVWRSAQRLLVPWLLFTTAYTVLRGVFEWRGVLSEHLVLGQPLLDVAGAMYGSDIAAQLYFLISLFLIRCLAPLARRLTAVPLVVSLGVFVGYTIAFRLLEPSLKSQFAYSLDPIVHAFWGLQYYLLGIVLARRHDWLGRRALPLGSIAAAVLLGLLLLDSASPIRNVFITYSYLLALYFGALALPVSRGLLRGLGRQSMGIYLLHNPALLKGVSMAIGAIMAGGLASYITIVAIVTAISFGASLFIERTSWLRFAFGLFDRAPRVAS